MADFCIAPRNEIPLAPEAIPQERIRTLRTNNIRHKLVNVVSQQQFTNFLLVHDHIHGNDLHPTHMRRLQTEENSGQATAKACCCSIQDT